MHWLVDRTERGKKWSESFVYIFFLELKIDFGQF